ncbi:F0F1 ATP synthase subunit epsilon [Aestuariivita sp.]|jgi:F-type H+-transporting ATPase subunit epsilon|uniref:F0F1 ATP synthase subunit epsilon n=1 Tax=Aestuariivita sp. TaxID=1872407 RepID=UPI00216D6EBB|nr:F0F1 ATP synthase subunit epsilon [Aestuariivita sp.]MCE8008480.1 F0F1 ATP synthase subunit epsilon [Aestuariivita sp.]
MADTIQFDLVSPERRLASLAVTAVQIPGADGDMTAMPDHAPLITTLRPGLLKVEAPGATSEYVVFGGFAEIGTDSISVLAEKAVPVGEMTRADLDAMVTEARDAVEAAKSSDQPHGLVDDAVKLLADMEALGTHMSL